MKIMMIVAVVVVVVVADAEFVVVQFVVVEVR